MYYFTFWTYFTVFKCFFFQRSFFTLHKWCLRLHLWKWISYLFSVISYIKLGKSDCDVFLLLGRPFAFKKIKGIQGLMKYNLLKLGRIHWVSMAKGNLKIRQSTIYYTGLLGRWDKRIVDQESHVPSIIFFYTFYRLRALKTLYLYFCIF